MAININFHSIWIFFAMILLIPPSTAETMTHRPAIAERGSARRAYNSDFEEFMGQMFSELPKPGTPDENKRGANVGYQPYWYGYDFAIGMHPKQTIARESDHENWDFEMHRGNRWRPPWGGSNMLMGAVEDALGADTLMNQDITEEDDDHNSNCAANLGPNCTLGPGAGYYAYEQMSAMKDRTKRCNWQICADVSPWAGKGIVCTVDKTGKVFQEMDLCVMEKMNCLGGTAAVDNLYNEYYSLRFPYALKPNWGRISIWGQYEANIFFSSAIPWTSGSRYWLILNGWPILPRSAMWKDDGFLPTWLRFWRNSLDRWWWVEYTITWHRNGNFLMSQARYYDWQSRFYVEYYDYYPWDIKYVDVFSRGYEVSFILHDLTLVHKGRCDLDKPRDDFLTDPEAVRADVQEGERDYHERVKESGAQYWDRSAEEPEYLEQ